MNLWIDDIRTPPEKGWMWARTDQESISVLLQGNVVLVSFGGFPGASLVAEWIADQAALGRISRLKWAVHTMKVVIKQRITAEMKSAEKFWLDFEGKDAM